MTIHANTVKTIARCSVVIISLIGLGTFGYLLARRDLRGARDSPYEAEDQGWEDAAPAGLLYRLQGIVALQVVDPRGLAVDEEGRIYVCSDSLLVFKPDGEPALEIPLAGTAGCIALDPGEAGEGAAIYLGVTDHVETYDRRGKQLAAWSSLGEKALITSLSVSQNSVYVADAGNRAVLRFSKGGRLLDRFQGADSSGFIVPSPYFDLASEMSPQGQERLWVANPGRHRLECYRPDGRRMTFWGRSSMAVDGFPGCCNPVHFALLVDGSFATSEKGIPRVKLYDHRGVFQGVVAGPRELGTDSANLDLAVNGRDMIYVLDPGASLVRIFAPLAEEG